MWQSVTEVLTVKRICIFCGSNPGIKPAYHQAAKEIGEILAQRGIGLVYGAGNVGLMGMVADAVLAGGGEVIGVIPEALVAMEVAHNRLTQLHIVGSMHERKALMVELSDGFIALPGGFGTFEEFCEVVTWAQLGIHQKPCGLLNVEGYYDHLIGLFNHAVEEKFLRPEYRSLVLQDSQPMALLEKLISYKPVTVQKWMEMRQT